MSEVPKIEKGAISLLQAQVQAYLLFRNSIDEQVEHDCKIRNQPYNGLRSWPESLRVWRDKKRKTLIAFAQSMGLCRKHIKEAVIALEQLEHNKES